MPGHRTYKQMDWGNIFEEGHSQCWERHKFTGFASWRSMWDTKVQVIHWPETAFQLQSMCRGNFVKESHPWQWTMAEPNQNEARWGRQKKNGNRIECWGISILDFRQYHYADFVISCWKKNCDKKVWESRAILGTLEPLLTGDGLICLGGEGEARDKWAHASSQGGNHTSADHSSKRNVYFSSFQTWKKIPGYFEKLIWTSLLAGW